MSKKHLIEAFADLAMAIKQQGCNTSLFIHSVDKEDIPECFVKDGYHETGKPLYRHKDHDGLTIFCSTTEKCECCGNEPLSTIPF